MPCPDCAAPTPAGARFCQQCGRRLDLPSDGLRAGDRRVVTALFADLVGYTRLVDELDAEDVRERVDRAFGLLAEAVVRFGGSLEKFVGDAVLAVFGAPTAHDDDATRACLCALEMQVALARGDPGTDRPLQLRIGVATGEVVAAVREVAGIRSVALTGDPMTTAARLQQLAEPGEILIEETTVGAAEARIESQRLAERVLRGQRRPVVVHRLLGERRVVRHARHNAAPLVGRELERARLTDLIRRAADSQTGGAVLIRGEAGVGKSRLLSEMESVARGAGFGWMWIDNVSYGTNQPYRDVRCMVDWLAEEMGLNPGVMAQRLLSWPDVDDEQKRRLTGALAVLARDSNMVLLRDEGWDPDRAVAPADAAENVRLLRLAARRWMAGLVADQPRCIVIDDFHWADRSSLPLIDEMVRATADLPLVVLAGTRPQVMPEWARLPNVEVIQLGGLDAAATEQLGTAVAGGALDREAARWLHERTAGNALFVGEIVRALVDSGGLEWAGGRLRMSRGAARTGVPMSLRSLLGARIDALAAAPRAALDVAAVIGMTFSEWLLFDVAGRTEDGTELQQLALAGFIEPVGDESAEAGGRWQFRHALIHDAAYGRLLSERRRNLHGLLADRLSLVEPAVPPAELARHRVAAGDVEGALPLLRQAAREAAAMGADLEAAAFREAAEGLLATAGDALGSRTEPV